VDQQIQSKQEIVQNRKQDMKVEFSGRKLFKKHCGLRMLRFKTYFMDEDSCSIHIKGSGSRDWDYLICACPHCNYGYTEMFGGHR